VPTTTVSWKPTARPLFTISFDQQDSIQAMQLLWNEDMDEDDQMFERLDQRRQKYCTMLKISWTEKVTNEEVLPHVNKASSISKMIWSIKRRWLGHVLRHDNLLHEIIEAKLLGKATQGRKRMESLHDITEVRDYGQLKLERFNVRQIKMETG